MKKSVHLFLTCLIFALQVSTGWSAFAESSSERRVKAGIKLFRTMLAADLDIIEKKDASDKLIILLIYSDNQSIAKKLSQSIKKSGKQGTEALIRKIPIAVEITSDLSFKKFQNRKVAGIFITQNMPEKDLKKIINFGVRNNLIVYSPFEGHVELGVMGGLSVEARVRPYINTKTLKASGIRIKQFFMKVTKFYE